MAWKGEEQEWSAVEQIILHVDNNGFQVTLKQHKKFAAQRYYFDVTGPLWRLNLLLTRLIFVLLRFDLSNLLRSTAKNTLKLCCCGPSSVEPPI